MRTAYISPHAFFQNPYILFWCLIASLYNDVTWRVLRGWHFKRKYVCNDPHKPIEKYLHRRLEGKTICHGIWFHSFDIFKPIINTYTDRSKSIIDLKYIKNHEFVWILSFVTHIYLFTPLSWCHDFGKLKYFTNRSSRLLLFCGIQKTAKSSQLLQLDFSSLRSDFTFYFTFDLLIFLDEWLLDKYMQSGHLKIQ